MLADQTPSLFLFLHSPDASSAITAHMLKCLKTTKTNKTFIITTKHQNKAAAVSLSAEGENENDDLKLTSLAR